MVDACPHPFGCEIHRSVSVCAQEYHGIDGREWGKQREREHSNLHTNKYGYGSITHLMHCFFFFMFLPFFLCLLEDRLKDRTVVQNRIMRTVCVRSYYSTKQPWARASSAKRWSTFSGIVNRESDDCDRNMRQKVNNIHQKNVNVNCMRVDEHKTNTMERAKCMTSIVPRCVCSAVLPTSSTSSTSPTLPNK